MKDIISKIKNYLVPETMEEVPVKEEPQANTKQATATAATVTTVNTIKVGNGPDMHYTAPVDDATYTDQQQPKLKVFKHPDMNVLVFTPTNFNDTRYIADALKNKKIIVINFEKVETSEQIRISDFMNGACYVLDGSVKQVTKRMSLYVPNGITIEFESSKPQA